MGDPLARLNSFFTELKRRRVFRVAAVYAFGAWLVIQIADTTFPHLTLPGWMVTAVIVLAVLGFPLALILAWAFDITPEGVERTAPREESDGQAPTRHSTIARLALAVLVVLAVTAGGWLGWRRWAAAPAAGLDSRVVAVLPFRVAGAEPGLAYLREGMLDLLAAKLTGEGGPRAVDPRTLMSAWRRASGEDDADLSREEALALAGDLGAGQVVLGEVVSLPGRVVLTASLNHVASGRSDAPVSVEGPPDSLPALVDRLVAGLLSVGAGEGERLASLTTTSLPALRLYLEGQAAYRRGRYTEAFIRLSRAVEMDSTFALAALMTSRVAGWPSGAPAGAVNRFQALAWRHRERLSTNDQVLLNAVAGPNYPGYSSTAERFAARQALVRQRPDDPEAWYEWGDGHLHAGAYIDIPDSISLQRAEEAFHRTLELDSTYLPALNHLFDIAVIRADTAAAQRYGELYLARDPTGQMAALIRNVRAAQTRGLAAVPEILARTDSIEVSGFYAMGLLGFHRQTYAISDALRKRLQDRLERWVPPGAEPGGEDTLATAVRDALYGDGDPDAAARAAAMLDQRVERASADTAGVQPLCVLGQWRLAREAGTGVSAIVQRLRAAGKEGRSDREAAALRCAELRDTWRAVEARSPDAPARIARLDSLLATGVVHSRLTREANLVLARLLEARGDLAGALRVLQRDPTFATTGQEYRPTYLRERGRVAALLGDTATAAEAYRFYLAMRVDPEPRLRSEVQRVRADLARLTGGRTR